MTTYLGKSYLFALLCVSFVNVCQSLCVLLSFSGFEGGVRDLIVLIPDHCLSFQSGFVLIINDNDNYHILAESRKKL